MTPPYNYPSYKVRMMDPYSQMKLQESLEEKAVKRFNDYEK